MSKTKVKSDSLKEHLVDVSRVTKVVKGGRNFSFRADVVVGDGLGSIGFGSGKAKEVADARAKATKEARKNLMKVQLLQNRTIYHDISVKKGAASVILRKAPPGTGIIAGGPMRAVFSCLGIKDIVAKSVGSASPSSMIAATMKALQMIQSPKLIATRRDIDVKQVTTAKKTSK